MHSGVAALDRKPAVRLTRLNGVVGRVPTFGGLGPEVRDGLTAQRYRSPIRFMRGHWGSRLQGRDELASIVEFRDEKVGSDPVNQTLAKGPPSLTRRSLTYDVDPVEA
jgi:hypothetical protein